MSTKVLKGERNLRRRISRGRSLIPDIIKEGVGDVAQDEEQKFPISSKIPRTTPSIVSKMFLRLATGVIQQQPSTSSEN